MADTNSIQKFSEDPDAPDIHPWTVLGSHIIMRFMQCMFPEFDSGKIQKKHLVAMSRHYHLLSTVSGVLPVITAPLTFKYIWGIKANESFAPLMRTAARGVGVGAAIGVAATAFYMHRLDADGVADRSYRLWFNEGQNRIDRGGMIGAAVGGVAIPLFVAGSQTAPGVAAIPGAKGLLKTAVQGACLGLVLGTVSAVALEATTKAVVKYSSRKELS